jgi:hypothetical protein
MRLVNSKFQISAGRDCSRIIILSVWFIILCINGVSGFRPVPRSTIVVNGKGQIRDWPKKAPYHTGDLLIIC